MSTGDWMLDEGMLRADALGGFWTAIDVVASTGSTNADLLARAVAVAGCPRGAGARRRGADRGPGPAWPVLVERARARR